MAKVTKTEEDQRLMDEWLAKGNKITKCETGAFTEGVLPGYGWGRKPKAVKPEKPAKKVSTKKK